MLRFSGIPARMALVLLLAGIPAFAIFGSYAIYRYHAERDTALDQLQQQAVSIASTRGILLDQADAMLRSLAGLPQLRNMSRDPSACGDVLVTALRNTTQYANIAAADLDGRVICRGIAPGPTGQVLVTDRAWFQRVVARRDFIVGNYAVGRGSGEASVHVAYPIHDSNGRMIGAVNAGIRLWWLSDRIAALNLPRGMVVALLDSDGTILVRHPASEDGSSVGNKMPEAAGIIAGQGRGITEARMLDGVYRTMAFEPLGGMRWDDISVVVAAEPSYLWDPVWRLIGLQSANFAIVIILGMVGALLGAYWMVVRPVRMLEQAVLAYSAGNRTARANQTARGEIGQLARAFNVMAERINVQEKALRETSDQKTRYLAIASHDLRQPLQVMMIKLESGIAHSEGLMRSSLQTAQRAAERLSGQLDLLAKVVRADLEGSSLKLEIHEVRMQDILEELASTHRETALAKGIEFHMVDSGLALSSNKDALLTIVNNLVMNAILYTSKGRILVGCRRRGAMCRIEVHDTGPGIPHESRVKIFKAYYPPGSRGKLRTRPWIIYCPRNRRATQACADAPFDSWQRLVLLCRSTTMERPMRKVLLIDDDASLREPLAVALREAGLEVAEAGEGAQALRLQLEDPVDLVITDIFMPGEEGIETIHTLRFRYPALKIIAISGGTAQGGHYDYLPVARQMGADRVLRKPFKLAALLSAIDELVPPREYGCRAPA